MLPKPFPILKKKANFKPVITFCHGFGELLQQAILQKNLYKSAPSGVYGLKVAAPLAIHGI
jgi:hypothetical protein